MAYEDVAAVAEKDILYLPTKSFVDTPKYLRTSSIAPRQLLLADLGFTAVLTPFEIQEYFLYAATILTGLKRWSEAANLLENVIAYPTKGDVISQQMVQAYKKWVLVTALLRGRVGPIPELTRMRQAKTLRTIAKPYDILVGLFDSDDAARFEDEVHEGMRIWEEDVNLGLVQSIRESYRQHRVKNLGTVFKTIPLNRVSQFTSAKSADAHIDIEDIISEMISSGQLNASIVTSVSGGRYLRFNTVDEGKTLDEGTVGDQIAATLTKINGIKDDIKNADRFMTEQNDYLTHLKRFKNATKGGFSGDVVGLPLIGLDEEDLMSG